MQLYVHPMSSNARRTRLVAKHLNLAVTETLVDLAKGEQRKPDYLALNPNAKVPTLVDGDLRLWESYAIMQYMCDKTGTEEAKKLYPTDLIARTDVNRWLFWCANEWSPTASKLNWENMLKPMLGAGQPDPVRVQEGEEAFKKQASVLDAHLKNRDWISGKGLTLADYAIASNLMAKDHAKYPLAGFTNILNWFAKIEATPAWKATAS